MRTLGATMVVCLVMACGGGKKPSLTSNASKPATGGEVACAQEIKLACPDGQIDACEKIKVETQKDVEAAKTSEDGGIGTAMVLGEDRLATEKHRCVPK